MPREYPKVTPNMVRTEVCDDDESGSTDWAGQEGDLPLWEPQFPTVNLVTEIPPYDEAPGFDEPDITERKFHHKNYKFNAYI